MPIADDPPVRANLWSNDVRVLLRPGLTYAELARQPGRGSFLLRPISFAFLIGLAIAISASGRPTLRMVLGSAVAWSFVPALHAASVALITLTLARGRLHSGRAVDLYFMGLLPWSAWLLGIAALASFTPPARDAAVWTTVLFTAPVPFIWAKIVTFAFFRRALGLSRRRSLAAVALNLAVVWGAILAFFLLSGQLGPRIVGRS
jgi:hypothetical protein